MNNQTTKPMKTNLFNFVLMGTIGVVGFSSIICGSAKANGFVRDEVQVNYIKRLDNKNCEVSIQDLRDETQVFTTLCKILGK